MLVKGTSEACTVGSLRFRVAGTGCRSYSLSFGVNDHLADLLTGPGDGKIRTPCIFGAGSRVEDRSRVASLELKAHDQGFNFWGSGFGVRGVQLGI